MSLWTIRTAATAGLELLKPFLIEELCAFKITLQLIQKLAARPRLTAEIFQNYLREALAFSFELQQQFVSVGSQ